MQGLPSAAMVLGQEMREPLVPGSLTAPVSQLRAESLAEGAGCTGRETLPLLPGKSKGSIQPCCLHPEPSLLRLQASQDGASLQWTCTCWKRKWEMDSTKIPGPFLLPPLHLRLPFHFCLAALVTIASLPFSHPPSLSSFPRGSCI